MHTVPRILVFDSGAGGLSVAREILRQTAHCQLHYAADSAGFPYGALADEQLLARLREQMTSLIERTDPDIVVVACNTASTVALDMLRENFALPFVGVVPAIKPAAQLSRTGAIGLLATPATVARRYTHDLIERFAGNCDVYLHGSSHLAALAERWLADGSLDRQILARELDGLLGQSGADKIDTIVLACTHFPLLKAPMIELLAARSQPLQWVDSGAAVARRVTQLLSQSPGLAATATGPAQQSVAFHFSGAGADDTQLQRRYQAYLFS